MNTVPSPKDVATKASVVFSSIKAIVSSPPISLGSNSSSTSSRNSTNSSESNPNSSENELTSETFPAASVAVAESVSPVMFISAVENINAPSAWATAVPKDVMPSKSSTVDPASAVPVTVGRN